MRRLLQGRPRVATMRPSFVLGVAAATLLLSTLVVATPSRRGTQQTTQMEPPKVAEDPDTGLFMRLCNDCHDSKQIVSQRRTRADWEAVITKMIEKGLDAPGKTSRRCSRFSTATMAGSSSTGRRRMKSLRCLTARSRTLTRSSPTGRRPDRSRTSTRSGKWRASTSRNSRARKTLSRTDVRNGIQESPSWMDLAIVAATAGGAGACDTREPPVEPVATPYKHTMSYAEARAVLDAHRDCLPAELAGKTPGSSSRAGHGGPRRMMRTPAGDWRGAMKTPSSTSECSAHRSRAGRGQPSWICASWRPGGRSGSAPRPPR